MGKFIQAGQADLLYFEAVLGVGGWDIDKGNGKYWLSNMRFTFNLVEVDVKARISGGMEALRPCDQPELPEGIKCFASVKPAMKRTCGGSKVRKTVWLLHTTLHRAHNLRVPQVFVPGEVYDVCFPALTIDLCNVHIAQL